MLPSPATLVEQHQLDRRGAPAQPVLQVAGIELHRLRPKRGNCRPVGDRVGPHQVERPEAAGIVEREAPAIVGFKQSMIVIVDFGGGDRPATLGRGRWPSSCDWRRRK